MRKAFTPIVALLALAACSNTPVEPAMDVSAQFASDLTVVSAAGSLRFPDGNSVRISAQSQCSDVCTVTGSVDLRIWGTGKVRFDVADLQVSAGDLIPTSIYAASFAPNEFVQAGDFAVILDENRPRDCEGFCEITWSIEVSEVVCGGPERVCILTPLYANTSGSGRIGVSS